MDITLDPDAYGRLAQGIHKYGSLSYFPNTEPTIRRGPLYPAVIWLVLAVNDDWYPYGVQAVQCLLFGLTVLMIFRMSEDFWNRRTAVFASMICCFNPILIWFTSRIWAEVLIFSLFTLFVALILRAVRRPSIHGSLLVGLVLGLLVLSKQTFLPFVLLLPGLLLFSCAPIKFRHSLCITAMALLTVLPWTVRNWHLTGLFLPVHASAGVQIQVGDRHLENFEGLSSLTYEEVPRIEDEVNAMIPPMPAHFSQAQKDAVGDAVLLKHSLVRYMNSPFFFLKKLAMNGFMFWFSASSAIKTFWIALFQLPILAFFVIFCVRIIQWREVRTVHGIIIMMVWFYFLFHLPFFAVARYSSVLIPVMSMYAARCFLVLITEKIDGCQARQGIVFHKSKTHDAR